MKYIVILLFSIIQLGCSNGQAFLEINDITDDHKIHIVPMEFMMSELGTSKEILIKKPILISDPETIRTIVKEWGHGKPKNPAFPIYRVFLTENEKIIRSLSINEDLTVLLTGHGRYKFSPDLLFKHQKTIKYNDWIKIETPTIGDAKKLISRLNQVNFVYPDFIEPSSDFTKSLGEISVVRKKVEGINEYDSILRRDFKIDSVFIRSTDYQIADSVSLTFWTSTKIDSLINAEYVIIKEWREFSDIRFNLVGCKPETVKSLIEKHRIQATIN